MREAVRRGGLHAFVREFWPVIEPGVPFVDGWHIGGVCRGLEAITNSETNKLIINIPPGHCKSSLVSAIWPAYHWIDLPADRWQAISWNRSLVIRDARKLIEIIESDLYQRAFPQAARLAKTTVAEGNFWTKQGGQRLSTTPAIGSTGEHCNIQLWDDPNKADDARRGQEPFDLTYERFSSTFSNRIADPKRFARVVIAQRLREGDLPDRLLQEGGWDHIMFPARYVPGAFWDMGNSLGITDPRTTPGELIWPERYDEAAVAELERNLKGDADAQMQQNPTPRQGGFFEESWCQWEWIELPKRPRFYQSWDLSFGGKTEAHSQCHGALWAVGKVRQVRRQTKPLMSVLAGSAPEYETVDLPEEILAYCLVDEVAGWWNYPQAKAEFLAAQKRPLWGRAVETLIEAKANGIALCDELEASGRRITRITPKDSKETRAAVASDDFRRGGVLFPSVVRCPTTFEARNEIVKFPRGQHDDRVDTTTQVILHVTDQLERYRQAMAASAKQIRRGRS